MQKKHCFIQTRVTEEERQYIQALAKKVGVPVSTLIRNVLLEPRKWCDLVVKSWEELQQK